MRRQTILKSEEARIRNMLSALNLSVNINFRRVRKIAQSCLLDSSRLSACLSVCLSVRMEQVAPTGRIFIKFDIWGLLKNLSRKFKFHYYQSRIMGTLQEDLSKLTTITRWILVRIEEMFPTQCVQTFKTHISCSTMFKRKSCLLRDNVEGEGGGNGTAGQATDENRARRMRLACWKTEDKNTRSKYVIIIAFPLKQWLHERASVLRYTCIASLMLLMSLWIVWTCHTSKTLTMFTLHSGHGGVNASQCTIELGYNVTQGFVSF